MKKKIRMLSLVLCLFLLAPCAIPAAKADNSPSVGVVPDPVLRAAINQKLAIIQKASRSNEQAITREEMALLTGSDAPEIDAAAEEDPSAVFELLGLSSMKQPYLPTEDNISDNPAHNHGIQSLEGLQYAVNLKSLELSENWISDLSPLKNLKNLTYLDLNRNNISDLTDLSEITKLIHLDLYNNTIWDITPLKSLKNVTFFDLHYANRGRAHLPIEALADMTGLQYISIESNDLVNEDLECLKSLEHLNYIKLNANHLKDLTAISKNMKQIMDGQKCIIEVNSQSLPQNETMQITAPSAGGTVTAEIPEILGVQELMNYESETGYSEGGITFSDSEGIPGVTVEFGEKLNNAVFQFENRKFGPALDAMEKAVVTFSYIDFMSGSVFNYNLALPTHFRQDADYHASLTASDLFVKIDSENGEKKSSVVTGSLVTSAGVPVALESVVSIKLKNALNQRDVEGLTASDILVEKNNFSFRVANSGVFKGGVYLTAEVTLRQAGANQDEVIPAGVLNFHFYDGDVANFRVDTKVKFDLSSLSKGQVSSLPVTVHIPGEQISFVECRDQYDNRIASSTQNEAGDYVFAASLNEIGSITKYWINAKNFLKPHISVSQIYSSEDVAGRFSVGALAVGTSAAPNVLFDGRIVPQTQELSVESSDPSVVKVENGKLVGVSVGEAELTLKEVYFPLTVAGQTFSSVCYTHPLKLKVNVINPTSAEEAPAINKVTPQGVRITGEDQAGKDAHMTAVVPAEALKKKEALELRAPMISLVLPKETIAALPSSDGVVVKAIMKKGTSDDFIKELTIVAESNGRPLSLAQVKTEIPADRLLKAGGNALEQACLVVKADGKILPQACIRKGVATFSAPSGAVVTFEQNKKTFSDLSENYWAAQSIAFVTARELFNGTEEGRFDAHIPMQRAMCWAVLARIEGQQSSSDSGRPWYEGARSWAVNAKISDGSSALSPMSREEFMTMLWRLNGSPQVGSQIGETAFADAAKISGFAREAMDWAVKEQIVVGDENKLLNPGDQLSRGEGSTILMRYLTKE